LGRVVGGDASIINGLIQVSGSNANLYLMNPAGIIFGSNAQLNVPASFFATTATGIGFGDKWFSATGVNDYATLVGTPSTFAFTTPVPGSIINAGSLIVQPGQNVTLLGGTVTNTGEISAPGGQITLSALPGQSVVRLSQAGHLLSLEIQAIGSSSTPNSLPFTPRSLPELLTGGSGGNATGLTVNSDGTVQLTGSGVSIPADSGTTIVSGKVNSSSTTPGETGGRVNVLGDKVAVIGGNIEASGTNGGGTVLIGGDYQGKGTVPNASRTFVSQGSLLNADAITDGNGGQVIIWSEQASAFYGNISAQGGSNSGNGGFVEVSGKGNLQFAGTVTTQAATGVPGTLLLDPKDILIQARGTDPVTGNSFFSDNPIAISTISGANLIAAIDAANVTLQANNDIIVDDDITATTVGNGLTLQAGRFITFNGDRTISLNGGDFTARINDENANPANRDPGTAQLGMNPGSQILTNGGSVTIEPGTFGGSAVGEVSLNGSTINSGTGNILITGTGRTGGGNNLDGIFITNGSVVETAGTGAITLNGTGSFGTNGDGIRIDGTDTLVRSVDGAINLTGSSGGTGNSNDGIVVAAQAVVQSTGAGSITLTGDATGASFNSGIYIPNGTISSTTGNISLIGSATGQGRGVLLENGGVLESTGGNITLQGASGNGDAGIRVDNSFVNPTGTGSGTVTFAADEILLLGTTRLRGSGILQLQTLTPSLDITIGGTPNDARLNLDDSKLATWQNGFSQIIIGGDNGSGVISLASNVTFNDPVTLRSSVGLGSINTTGFTLTGADNATITLLANQKITTGNITNPGRDITLISNSGSIDTAGGLLTSSSSLGNGGAIALLAAGNITTSDLRSQGIGNSGTIALSSTAGEINTTTAILDSSSSLGNGGAIALAAVGNITTSQLRSFSNGSGNGGDILLTSSQGEINTSASGLFSGFIDLTSSGTGNGGAIRLQADGNIITATLSTDADGSGKGGDITLTSNQGGIDTLRGILDSESLAGEGGAIALSATGSITTAELNSSSRGSGKGGNITFTSTTGAIDTVAGTLNSSSDSGRAGAIALSASGNITSSNITSNADNGAGSDITLNTQAGAISSGNLNASGSTSGGNITVTASDLITTGTIISASIFGNGGNVTLDPQNDIQVSFINAQGGSGGRGGSVDITTASLFRATDTFIDQNGVTASISTTGGTDGSNIIIRHDGGARGISFDVGSATTTNGTAGTITTGFTNSLPLQSFPGSYTQGNIQLITQNPPTSPLPPPLIPVISVLPDLSGILKDIQGESLSPRQVNTTLGKLTFNTTAIWRERITQALAIGQVDKAVLLIEQLRTQEFQNYFGGDLALTSAESVTIEQTQALLSDVASKTGKTPAVIYVFSQPEQLQLILVTSKGKPLLKTVYQADRATLLKMALQFRSQVTETRKKTGYQATAKQLYQWLIAPLTAELQAQKIDTLVFSMDTGLRSLPLAALYDGQQFLVENYSIGLIPSINLTDTRYENVKNAEILAMGASKFSDQKSLPAVPVELARIAGSPQNPAPNRELVPTDESSVTTEGLWRGKSFINQAFTLGNLKSQRAKQPFGLIHLATHGEFNLGAPRNSYIQLWDSKLRLDQLRQLGWSNPPVELLVLSACRTAVGNEEAELGFGGLAVAAGVKSAVASLWYVSDEGTLGLMSEFYQQLKTAPMKAEALRQAQIAMIKGQVRFEGGQLLTTGSRGALPLPPELAQGGEKNLSHPAYWAAFTMIGSPW